MTRDVSFGFPDSNVDSPNKYFERLLVRSVFVTINSASSTMSRNDECVQVIVRCRPLFGKELAEGRQRIVEMDTSRGEVVLKNPKASHPSEAERKFTFDRIFD